MAASRTWTEATIPLVSAPDGTTLDMYDPQWVSGSNIYAIKGRFGLSPNGYFLVGIEAREAWRDDTHRLSTSDTNTASMQSSHHPNGSAPLASMPVYRPHELCKEAIHHVLAWACAPSQEDLSFAARLDGEAHGRHTLVEAEENGGPEAIQQVLVKVLEAAHPGTHLYLSGSEQQVWRLYNTARGCGLQPQEISVQCAADSLCPVYCVHCATYQETANVGETTCVHCNMRLVIRAHFSRALGAYMGVVADADHPFAKALS